MDLDLIVANMVITLNNLLTKDMM